MALLVFSYLTRRPLVHCRGTPIRSNPAFCIFGIVEGQERSFTRGESAENPPRGFVFKNPPRRFQYRDYVVKAGDAGYQKDEPERNLDDLNLPLSFFVPLRVLRDFVMRSRL